MALTVRGTEAADSFAGPPFSFVPKYSFPQQAGEIKAAELLKQELGILGISPQEQAAGAPADGPSCIVAINLPHLFAAAPCPEEHAADSCGAALPQTGAAESAAGPADADRTE